MPDVLWCLNVPLDRWMLRLAEGWRFDWIVEPMKGPHGFYAILMWREDAPS